MNEELRAMDSNLGWRFDNSYALLPEALFQRVLPEPVRQPGLTLCNQELLAAMGLEALGSAPDAAELFCGNRIPEGAEPIAQAYAGHQFGHLTMLGDGRAVLLGEQVTPDGRRLDIQLKGSGRTPFSRRGDGRAALGPMLREYLISEAMHFLGIPTTRSLAVATTGEPVFREEELPGAILTRVAASHIRVGTFEYAARIGEPETLRALADHSIARHHPEAAAEDNPYLALLEEVVERQSRLIAQWLQVGFIHGVMNTDNMAASGETIDYGPCAFMDSYDPKTVFSSIDRQGRYAFANQPDIAQWNLARFAECLVSLLSKDDEKHGLELANEIVASFSTRFQSHWVSGMRAKLGLFTQEDDDAALAESLLQWMHENQADYTNTFRSLCPQASDSEAGDPEFQEWKASWLARLARQPQSNEEVVTRMRSANPSIIPRNHKVEEVLAAAHEGDLQPIKRFLEALSHPFDHCVERSEFTEPPPPGLARYQTFCGT